MFLQQAQTIVVHQQHQQLHHPELKRKQLPQHQRKISDAISTISTTNQQDGGIGRKKNFIENLVLTASDLKLLIDLVTSSERIHAQMVTTIKLFNERDTAADISYYRFDPPDLGSYDLDCVEPEVIDKYEKKSKEYIQNNDDFGKMCERLLQD